MLGRRLSLSARLRLRMEKRTSGFTHPTLSLTDTNAQYSVRNTEWLTSEVISVLTCNLESVYYRRKKRDLDAYRLFGSLTPSDAETQL